MYNFHNKLMIIEFGSLSNKDHLTVNRMMLKQLSLDKLQRLKGEIGMNGEPNFLLPCEKGSPFISFCK